MTQATQVQEKKVVSAEEFHKRVDIEAAHLEYMDGLKPEEARTRATYVISQKYRTKNHN